MVWSEAMSEVTQLIQAMGKGDVAAAERLLPIIYEELRALARQRMAQERDGHTLQGTALVHEAYLRLAGDGDMQWDSKGHFFAAAAEAMRRILVEHARRKKSFKRGGGRERVDLDDDQLPAIASPCADVDELLSLNDALDRLSAEDPAKAKLVKLLYFAGLNLAEAASVLDISRTTAHRHWIFARAWLCEAMSSSPRS